MKSTSKRTRFSLPSFSLLRFSVRFLLLIVFLVACVLGWISWRIQTAKEELLLARKIETAASGNVGWSRYEYGDYVRPNPGWNYNWLMDRRPLHVTMLTYHNREITSLDSLKPFKHLEKLRLNCPKLIDIEALRQFPKLEELDFYGIFEGCESLEDFEVLSDLVHLKKLEFTRCDELKTLKPIQNLKNLKTLEINNCKNEINDLELINELQSLTKFELYKIPWVTDVSFLTDKLSKLKTLKIRRCKSIESLDSFNMLPQLKMLDLNSCENFQSCAGIEKFSGLTYLIVDQTAVKKLCLKHQNLHILSASENLLLEEVDVSGLAGIRSINLRRCKNLKSVRGLSHLQSLEEIDVAWCKSLETVGVLSDLPELSKIDLALCPKLKQLKIVNCDRLIGLTQIDCAEELEDLWIENCQAFISLKDPFYRKVSVKKLTIKNCGVSREEADQFRKRYPEIEFDYEPRQEVTTQ